MRHQLTQRLRGALERNHRLQPQSHTTSCQRRSSFHKSCRRCISFFDVHHEPPSNVIDVSPLAQLLRERVREYTLTNTLNLVGILANRGPHRHDSEVYSDRIQENFREDGIHYDLWRCPSGGGDPSPESVQRIKEQIQRANQRDDVHGILVFYPIYNQHLIGKGPYKDKVTGVYYKTQDDHFRDLVEPRKDVEGLCGTKWFQVKDSTSTGSKWNKKLQLYPCTALSVLWILEEYHIKQKSQATQSLPLYEDIHKANDAWKNQTVSIVNRSEIMGRPLAAMLARKGATVYSIDIDSILKFRPNGRLHRCNPGETTLQTCLEESNIVVTGVPDPNFQLSLEHVQEGTTIVNVSEYPNVDEETLFEERPDVQYIPQVGKVTVAVLENNLMHLKKVQDQES